MDAISRGEGEGPPWARVAGAPTGAAPPRGNLGMWGARAERRGTGKAEGERESGRARAGRARVRLLGLHDADADSPTPPLSPCLCSPPASLPRTPGSPPCPAAARPPPQRRSAGPGASRQQGLTHTQFTRAAAGAATADCEAAGRAGAVWGSRLHHPGSPQPPRAGGGDASAPATTRLQSTGLTEPFLTLFASCSPGRLF